MPIEPLSANDRPSTVRPKTIGVRHSWATSATVWIVVGILAAAQRYTRGRIGDHPIAFTKALAAYLPAIVVWTAVTPVIWWSARRLPLSGHRRWRNLALHVTAGSVFVVGLNLLVLTASQLGGSTTLGAQTIGREWFDLTISRSAPTLVAYLFIVVLSQWLGDRSAVWSSGGEQTVMIPTAPYLERIPVNSSGRIVLLDVDDVQWIEAKGNSVLIHIKGREYRLRETLRKVEHRLDPARFARIHRSTVVNLKSVASFEHFSHGDYDVLLDDGTLLRLSRTFRDRVIGRVGAAMNG